MGPEFISKATRDAFREVLVGFVLRDIDLFFEGAGLSYNKDYEPPVSGARRSLVEQYYAGIDFESPHDTKKLLHVYGEITFRLGQISSEDTNRNNLLRLMKRDGYSFDGEYFVPIPSRQLPPVETIRALATSLDLQGLSAEVGRMAQAAEDDPALAVGTAKELIETICKTILEDRGVSHKEEDLPKLVRTVAKELLLLPENIPDNAKGSDVISRLLSSLNQVAQGIAELRNLYGTGHGRDGRFIGIHPRHAKLAVGAAATLGMFLMETHIARSSGDPYSTSKGHDIT